MAERNVNTARTRLNEQFVDIRLIEAAANKMNFWVAKRTEQRDLSLAEVFRITESLVQTGVHIGRKRKG